MSPGTVVAERIVGGVAGEVAQAEPSPTAPVIAGVIEAARIAKTFVAAAGGIVLATGSFDTRDSRWLRGPATTYTEHG
jgi:hypothetical protein